MARQGSSDFTALQHTPAVFERLLADPRVDPACNHHAAIAAAADAAQHADTLPLFQRLIANPRADPSAQRCEALRSYARAWHPVAVQTLLADPRAHVAQFGSDALPASAEGHMLGAGYSARHASLNFGYTYLGLAWRSSREELQREHLHVVQLQLRVVQLLAEDPRVGATANDSDALRLVAQCGFTAVVSYLLSLGAVRWSCKT